MNDNFTNEYKKLISQYQPTPEKSRKDFTKENIVELMQLAVDIIKNMGNPAFKLTPEQKVQKLKMYRDAIEALQKDVENTEDEETIEESKKEGGKKDACYRKAKAKYDVFPSAYASGYIAKCRKAKGKIK